MASSPIVLGLSALAFCTWAVSLAGIASLQDECTSGWDLGAINGFSSNLPCMRLFRYQWFIVSLEFVLVVALLIAAAAGMYAKSRLSWVGLFAVATLLYIQMCDSFLTMHNWADSAGIGGSLKNRINVMVAGCIMTATVNSLLLVAFGIGEEEAPKPVSGDKANAV